MQTKPTAPRSHIPTASMRAFPSLSCWARAGLVNTDYMGFSGWVASGSLAWAIASKTLLYNMSVVPLLAVPHSPRTWECFSLWWDTPDWLHCVRVCPGWSLGPWVSVLTRRLMCYQAVTPCHSESRDVTFFFPWELIWPAISLDPTWWINESYDAVQICFSVALINQCCEILSSDSESA